MIKLRVGVLMGGKSIEHEVSFNSGRTVCDHLDTEQYEIIPIFQTIYGSLFILPWHFLHRGKTNDFVHRLKHEATEICWDDLKNITDFIYLAIHGRYAEDGTVQGFLKLLDIPYLGSGVFASALCMDKAMQKHFLRKAAIDVPQGILLTPDQINSYTNRIDELYSVLKQKKICPPYIVKPNSEGSSFGISIVTDKQKMLAALKKACTIYPNKNQSVLIEEKIKGMEFSCITISDYKTNKLIPLPATEVITDKSIDFFDFDHKYMPGLVTEFTPPRCSKKLQKKIQDTCVKTTQVLNITNLSRIDGFLTEDERVIIVDPNTLSGMGPASFLFREAAEINLSHTRLINHLIETELFHYGMLNKANKTDRNNMSKEKIRVAVLMGGHTNEKEISLESGRNIVYKLSPQKYRAIPIFVNHAMELFSINQSILVRNSTHEINTLLKPEMRIKWANLPNIADFVFIGLHGGEGENGSVQGALEMLEMPYNGSGILASALCMDKYKTSEFLQINGFDVANSVLINKNEWKNQKNELLKTVYKSLNLFPLIIKPHDDGCSIMVQKVNNEKQLEKAIEHVFASDKEHVMVEEYITGMELTVGVVGNEKPKAFPPSQVVAKKDILSIKEKFLPGAGENQTPAMLPKETLAKIQDIMEKVYSAVGCKGYARIDCFYQSAKQSPTQKERIIILEINTLPALTPATCLFHQAAEIGIKPMDLIDQIITLGFQDYKKETVIDKSSQSAIQKEV